MDYNKFFAALNHLSVEPYSQAVLAMLQKNAPKAIEDISRLPAEKQSSFTKLLLGLANGDQQSAKPFIYSLLFHVSQDKNYLRQAVSEYQNVEIPALNYIHDYYTLSNIRMKFHTREEREVIPLEFLRQIYVKAVSNIIENFQPKNPVKTDPSRVVVIVDQLLDKGHAPTFRALKLVQALQKIHDKDVLLVNSCMHSAFNSGLIARRKFAAVKPQLSTRDSEIVDGMAIRVFQPDPPILSEESLQSVIDKIAGFGPSGILVVGNQCTIAEIFAGDCFTLCSPLHNDLVPESINVNFHSHTSDPFQHDSNSYSQDEKLKALNLFQFEGPYDIPAKKGGVQRSDLNLPKGRPIIVIVGNRLDFDIDDGFLDMLDNVVLRSDAFVFFVGNFEKFKHLKQTWSNLAENSENCPFHTDLISVFELCDFYVAPKRLGGGSSAVYAMAAGLPVLSLPYGDASITAQHFPTINDYEEMEEIAVQLSTDTEKLEEYKTHAINGACEIKDSEDLAKEYLVQFNKNLSKNN